MKLLEDKSETNKEKYESYKNLFEKLRKRSKKVYYSNLINKYQNDSKRIWHTLKELSGKIKAKSNSLPKTIKVNNSNQYKAEDIANEFNKFFTNVGPNLAKNIPVVNHKI